MAVRLQPRRLTRALLNVISRAGLAQLIDHTELKPEATADDIARLAAEGVELGVYAVCVSPSMVNAVSAVLPPDGPLIAAVAGFPSGKHLSEIKASEAARAVSAGAAEIDMVIDVGAALSGELSAVRADIGAVRQAVPTATLKVIVESAALLELSGEPLLTDVCRVAEDAGADFVKTSTGFHRCGGSSERAVELMCRAVGGRLGVKASGGIRTADYARELVNAGATRLGMSATRDVLAGL